VKKDDTIFLIVVVLLVFFSGSFFASNVGSDNFDDFTGLAYGDSRSYSSEVLDTDKPPKQKTPSECYDDCLTACGATGGQPPSCSDQCTTKCNKDTGKNPAKATRKVVRR